MADAKEKPSDCDVAELGVGTREKRVSVQERILRQVGREVSHKTGANMASPTPRRKAITI